MRKKRERDEILRRDRGGSGRKGMARMSCPARLAATMVKGRDEQGRLPSWRNGDAMRKNEKKR